jgi:hypothetical protein
MNKQAWNILQRGRGILQMQPLGCWGNRKPSFCSGCGPGEYYLCKTCGLLQPWCKGKSDGYGEICDRCWVIAQQMHEAVGVAIESAQERD